jgi:hypothetical protein
MKKKMVLFILTLALAALPAWSMAATVEGTIQGLTCVTMGKVCPIGQEDPMIAGERLFVLLNKTGQDYFFVPNLDRGILTRHINETVRVTGEIDKKHDAIHAEKLEVKKNGTWKTTWSKEMEQEMLEKMRKRAW